MTLMDGKYRMLINTEMHDFISWACYLLVK